MEKLDTINNIIKFFETEERKNIESYRMNVGDLNFNLKLAIPIFIFSITLTISLYNPYTLYLVLAEIGGLVVVFAHNIIASWGLIKDYADKKATFYVVINFLQSLKIFDIDADLSPLMNAIGKLHSDKNIISTDFKKYQKEWRTDVVGALDVINMDLLKNSKWKV